MKKLSSFDTLLSEIQTIASTLFLKSTAQRPNPAHEKQHHATQKEMTLESLTPSEKDLSGRLMRINHTGEVCAQALYRGQALKAKDTKTREHLYHAAQEEKDHLSWCKERLTELDTRPSLLNPLWYLGSFTIGAFAASISDSLSYGFIVETEHQVMHHLEKHLAKISPNDLKSRAILKQMYADEAQHAINAEVSGAQALPFPIKMIMKLQSKVMTSTAYYL